MAATTDLVPPAVGQWNRLTGLPEETHSLIGERAEASGAFKYTAVGQSKSTVSLFLMLVRLSSKPSYIEGATSLRSALLRKMA